MNNKTLPIVSALFLTMAMTVHFPGTGFAMSDSEAETLYFQGKRVQSSGDYNQAIKAFNKSANQGYAPAQYQLGLMLSSGTGFKRDYRKAVIWYEKAAEQNYVPAQFQLGQVFKDGIGVKRDLKKSYKWYYRAAKNGNELAEKEKFDLENTMDKRDLLKVTKELEAEKKWSKKSFLPW